MKDLTNSQIERRNVLNNNLAVREIYEQVGFQGVRLRGKLSLPNSRLHIFSRLMSELSRGFWSSMGEELQRV